GVGDGGREGCVCPRISVILNSGFKPCFSIKNRTSVCHGVDYKFNYKNGGFLEILSLFLHITTKTWVASLCVLDNLAESFLPLNDVTGPPKEGFVISCPDLTAVRSSSTVEHREEDPILPPALHFGDVLSL
ncbi:hypothetical protein K5549_021586, partial [Capra hircus]